MTKVVLVTRRPALHITEDCRTSRHRSCHGATSIRCISGDSSDRCTESLPCTCSCHQQMHG